MTTIPQTAETPVNAPAPRRIRRADTFRERLGKLARAAWYRFLQAFVKPLCVCLFGLRVQGRKNIPPTGGALLVANHQSYLDPIIVSVAMHRRPNYLARVGLFKWAPFRWLIKSLDAIPIRNEAIGLEGIKEALRRLHRGECVLIFPEGSRTPDGALHKLFPGFTTLAVRARVPIVPVGIVGAFAAWPCHRKFPRLRKISVFFAPPVTAEEMRATAESEALALIQQRIAEAMVQARRYCGKQSEISGQVSAIKSAVTTISDC